MYLKSKFLVFLIKIEYPNIKIMDANKYKNKYLERKPIAANKPIKKQSKN